MSENETYIADKKFDNIDFTTQIIAKGVYENCEFVQCNFEGCDLSHIQLIDSRFIGCNLSMIKMTGSTLNSVMFDECKMLGNHFETCSEFLFSVSFRNCTLNFCSFYKRVMKKSKFIGCSIQEADFTDADLAGSVLQHCNLYKTKFENTNLEKADLSSAFNFVIDPEQNRLKKAKFSQQGLDGLLAKYDIIIN